MPRRSAVLAALACAVATLGALAPAASANDAGSVTHSAGQVSATLAWDKADSGIGNPRLFVVRAGVRYDLTIADICLEGCIVVPDAQDEDAARSSAVKVADLDGDGEPEVLVDVFSGGAHCCVTMRLLTFDGTGYTSTDRDWRDLGYVLRDADGDGRPELVGYDPAFSAAFTAFVFSTFPPQILRVDHGKLVDVTKRFPKLVRADAARQLEQLRKLKRDDDVRGVLAAYVADEYLLGQGSTGLKELDRQRRRGAITKAFRPYLLKRLKSWGYR